MDIHFISTLTPEDEDRFAPMVINAVKAILDLMPITYTVRIETANGRRFQHSRAEGAPTDAEEPSELLAGRGAPFGLHRVGLR